MYLNTFVFALFLASGLGSPISDNEVLAHSELDRIKTLMAALLKYIGPELNRKPKHGNIMSSNLKDVELASTFLDSKIYVSYLKFVKLTQANKVVDNYKTDPKTLASTFRIRIPLISETYKYKINGTMLSHKVSGEGHLTYVITNTSFTISDLKFHDSPHNLQIASMKIDNEINNLMVKFSGLRVAGMKLEAFEKVLQAKALAVLRDEFHFSKARTTEIEADVDLMMFGNSLEQVVKWLKKHTKRVSFE